MAPILEMEVECGKQKSRLLRGMVVLRGTVNYCMFGGVSGSDRSVTESHNMHVIVFNRCLPLAMVLKQLLQ